VVHSDNRIPENGPQSIGKGTDVSGVGSSEPARPWVGGGDKPLPTPEAPVPSCCPWSRLPLLYCGCHCWNGSPSSYIIADARGLPFAGKKPAGGQAEPLQTPEADVPNYSVHHYVSPQRFDPTTKAHRLLPPPLGAESLEPPPPTAPAAEGGGHSDLREAFPYAHIEAISNTTSEEEKEKREKREKKHRKNLESHCPSVYLHGKCEEGHEFAKGVICNREWCLPVEGQCGGKNGLGHQRRMGHWLPKARKIGPMGRFVFTVPPEVRGKYRSPQTLGKLGTGARRLLQRHGFSRGLRRWHLFGEDHRSHGAGVGEEVVTSAPKYHPHLEALVDGGGYLSRKQLGAIKRSWANILKVPLSRINVYYEFVQPDDIRKKLHRVSYALRPTFTDWRWDVDLAYKMIGFHNSQTWGNWDGPDLWEMPEGDPEYLGSALEALAESRCPIDHTPITWDGLLSGTEVKRPAWEDMGGGYWQMAIPPPNG